MICLIPLFNIFTIRVISYIPDDNIEIKVEKLNFGKRNFEGISYLLVSVSFTEIFENNEMMKT